MRIASLCILVFAQQVAMGAVEDGGEKVLLHCEVVDIDSGLPLACRVYVRSPDGRWLFARSASEQGSAVTYDKQRLDHSLERHTTVSAHPFVFDVSPGRYTITVERGKEYLPATKTVDVGADGQELTIGLRRWVDMADLGWYSGDTHVHRSLEELPNIMLAEDVNVSFPLTYWVTVSDTSPEGGDKNTEVGAAREPIYVDPTHVIYPINTEYEIGRVGRQRHTLGAVFVLGHKTPLKLGAPPVGPIAAEARRQGALLDLDKHSWPWSLMLVPVMDVDLFELSNNHVWRTEFAFRRWTLDAVADYMQLDADEGGLTEWGWIDFGLKTYYALLDCGFRMRPTAGTASGVHPVPLGFGRVYVKLDGPFSYERWMEGLDAGRSFVTTGPMLTLKIDGRMPGSTIQAAGRAVRSCPISGMAQSDNRLKAIEIIVNGEVVERVKAANRQTDGRSYQCPFETAVDLDGSCWIAVRVLEDRADGRVRFAHSSPVHVEVADEPLRPRREEVDYLVGRMSEELERNRDVLAPEALDEYRRALDVYENLRATAR